jgi:hypothetical protein
MGLEAQRQCGGLFGHIVATLKHLGVSRSVSESEDCNSHSADNKDWETSMRKRTNRVAYRYDTAAAMLHSGGLQLVGQPPEILKVELKTCEETLA